MTMTNPLYGIYNGYYGIWNVDWDLVAHLDPDYAKKYLSTHQTLPEFSDVSITETTEWMRQRAQADRLIQREHELAIDHGYDRYISKDELTEEDKAVLDLTHTPAGKNTEPTVQQVNQMVPVHIPPRITDPAEILGPDDNENGDEVFYLENEKRTTTKRRERVKAVSNYRYGHYYPSAAHYEIQRINPPPPTVPLLPLPRNFMVTGSKVVVNDNYCYNIQAHPLLDDHSILSGEMFIENETHLKLVSYQYTINKVYDTYRPSNAFKRRVVFNKKNGNLFVLSWERKDRAKKGRFYMKIRGITTHINFLTIHCQSFNKRHLTRFARRMFEVTRDKICGTPVFNPISNMMTDTATHEKIIKFIIALLWQFKAGQRLPWMDENTIDSIAAIREAWTEYGRNRYGYEERDKKQLFATKPTYKGLFKKLRKKPHPTTLFRGVLGEAYSNATYKLSIALNHERHFHIGNFISFIELMFQNKPLYHFVSHLVAHKPEDIRDVIQALMWAGHEMTFGRNADTNKPVFNKYIKALEAQFANISHEPEIIKWELFRDTVNMADRYNISINANQLCKWEVIKGLHDRFVQFMNRDKAVQRELAGVEFVEFPHPTKEYGGFVFQFLKNVDDLTEEGRDMKHCVGGYGRRCVSGQSIIFSMRKAGVGFVTIELDGDDFNLRILQKYSRHDVTITNPEILDIINQWHNDVRQLNKEKDYTYGSQCAIVTRYVGAIASLLDKNMPEEMKTPLRSSITGDDKLIDELGLREYVKRVLSNNQRIASNLQKTDALFDGGFEYDAPIVRAPIRAVQVPAQGVREVPGRDATQVVEQLRDLMNRITEVGNG